MTTLQRLLDFWNPPSSEQQSPSTGSFRLLAEWDNQRSLDESELERLRQQVNDTVVTRADVEVLVEQMRCSPCSRPVLEQLVVESLRRVVLANEAIDPEETEWLRQLLVTDGVGRTETRLLADLHTRARRICPEFQLLLDRCLGH